MSNLASKLVQVSPKWNKSGTFKDQFQYILDRLAEPKYSETDLKKSQISPIWGQSDPIWVPNSTSLSQTNPAENPRDPITLKDDLLGNFCLESFLRFTMK